MTVFKPEPFSSEVNRLFNTLFTGAEDRPERWTPAMDLVEAEDHFVLKADLPGLSEEDISIEIQDNTLTVSGERQAEHEERHRGWYRVERSFGRFSRSLTLPEGVNPEAVAASFDRGVLSITIPKPEQRKPRRVTISASGQRVEHPAVESTATEQPAGAPPSGGGGGPMGPGIAPDAPPVEGQGGREREMPPVAGGEEPSGSVENRSSQSSSDQATPAQAGQSTGQPAGGQPAPDRARRPEHRHGRGAARRPAAGHHARRHRAGRDRVGLAGRDERDARLVGPGRVEVHRPGRPRPRVGHRGRAGRR